jgi:hypothetical protein
MVVGGGITSSLHNKPQLPIWWWEGGSPRCIHGAEKMAGQLMDSALSIRTLLIVI